MSVEIFKSLNNIRTFRANARELAVDVLEEISEKIKIVIEERRQEELQANTFKQEYQNKLRKYRDMLLAEGIDPNELLSTLPFKVVKKRTPRPPKYEYIENGECKICCFVRALYPPCLNSCARASTVESLSSCSSTGRAKFF